MDLLKMAQDAGFDVHQRKGEIRSALDFCANDITATVEKFARLVAEAEREACAKIAEDKMLFLSCSKNGHGIADAIRKRSNA